MRYIYLLKSVNQNFFYIGSAYNLKKRLEEHKQGKCPTTKRYLPLRLVYYEAYTADLDANTREQKLKQYGSSHQNLKRRRKNSISGGA
jgi:putative endonuclease